MKNFIETYNVSRETYELLKAYEASLADWQKKFNLVSNASLPDSWNRHFLDSAQLFQYIPEQAKTLLDFGSGAGFPGMVLAIMAAEKTPYLKVKLIESTGKKTLYLNEVKKIVGVNVEIINDRVEKLPSQKADVITSRAMASLNDLLNYTGRFAAPQTICIFPKGQKYAEEIAEARKNWKFDCQIHDSITSSEGKILVISRLLKIKGDK